MPKRPSRTYKLKPNAAVALLVLVLIFTIYRVVQISPLTDEVSPTVPDQTLPAGDELITAYFTEPYAAAKTGGLDQVISAAIDQAGASVDLAIYNINLENVGAALLRAHRRGVKVRLVIESDALDGSVAQSLLDAGLPILGDRRQESMHNKFLIIDGEEVWTGSMNLTFTGVYDDHNQMVRVRSQRVAQNYTAEFEEMFVDDQFGAGSPANTPYPLVEMDGIQINTYFSPDDQVAAHLVDLIGSAEESIAFLAYSFTSDPLAEAVLERAGAGVQVRGVFDASQVNSNTGGEFQRLRDAGLDVRLDTLDGQMHQKVLMIDGQIVSFGSYNFSTNAENRNDENVLIVHDPALTGQFLLEFERIFARSE
jgi:phosphatidylserine/phosphatidylglycerophosphate/cardiolipin synthase-like enzyme